MNATADRPSLQEKVGRALADGNLTQRDEPCSLDKVLALGLVGMDDPITDAIYRLKYANEARSYRDAIRAVLALARRLNRVDNWQMGSKLQAMAMEVLNYWVAPACPACTGRRAQIITGTPHLEDEPCPACYGSGKRPYPWLSQHGRDKSERCHTSLLIAVDESERRIRDKLISRLGPDLRDAIIDYPWID